MVSVKLARLTALALAELIEDNMRDTAWYDRKCSCGYSHPTNAFNVCPQCGTPQPAPEWMPKVATLLRERAEREEAPTGTESFE